MLSEQLEPELEVRSSWNLQAVFFRPGHKCCEGYNDLACRVSEFRMLGELCLVYSPNRIPMGPTLRSDKTLKQKNGRLLKDTTGCLNFGLSGSSKNGTDPKITVNIHTLSSIPFVQVLVENQLISPSGFGHVAQAAEHLMDSQSLIWNWNHSDLCPNP